MPLEEATRHLASYMQRDLRRLMERERARSDRGEDVRFDSVSRMATWENRRGDVIGRWYGEVLASYVIRDRILRWAWAGRSSISVPTHGELIAREGQSREVPQLAMSVVGDLDEDEACTLVRLGIVVAHGEGLEIRRSDEEVTFIGLFDSPRPREGGPPNPARYSVPPPPVVADRPGSAARTGSSPPSGRAASPASARGGSPPRMSSPPGDRRSSPPVAPYRSLPPIREIYEPRTSRPAARAVEAPPDKKIREPARSVFLPVATAVLNGLTKAVPGFKQGLFVLTVDPEISPGSGEKRRLVVVLVANDAAGLLRAIDPSRELIEAAARMVEADREDGNGPWRKLSARITPKPDGGATMNVDVI